MHKPSPGEEFFLEHEAVNFPLPIIFLCNICLVLLSV